MRVILSAILALVALCCLAALLLMFAPMAAVSGNANYVIHLPEIAHPQGALNMSPFPFIVIMLFAIPLAAIIGGVLLATLKILKGNGGARGGASDVEETRLIQELHRGLNRMEERVESLETLLMEKSDRRKTHE